MRILWLLCVFVLLVASRPELLIIDTFEDRGNWDISTTEGCTIKIVLDHVNAKEGQKSFRLEAEFTEECDQGMCLAGITHDAPDLHGYTFLRFWMKADTVVNMVFGIYLESHTDGYFYAVPLSTRWSLITVPFSEFESDDNPLPLAPEDVETISFFLMTNNPVRVKINIDEFVALTDSDNNGIPDIDEAALIDGAKNSEHAADQYFDEGDYENAEKYYEEARSLYLQAGDQEKAEEMDQRAEKSRGWVYYEEAEDLYSQGQYEKAAEVYEEARRHFVVIGDVEMVDTIESRLKELSTSEEVESSPLPEISDEVRTQDERGGARGLFFVLIFVCLVGVGVYFWKFRGGEKVEKPEKTVPLPPEVKDTKSQKLTCPFCKNEIEEEWVSCPHCGVRLQEDTRIY